MSAQLTLTEVAILFSRIAALDNRKTTKEGVEAFAAALIPMTPQDAMSAVDKHRQQSTEWLMPKHLNDIVRSLRAERIRQQPAPLPPDEIADEARRFIAWEKKALDLIGDGHPTEAAQAEADRLFKIERAPLIAGRVTVPELAKVPER